MGGRRVWGGWGSSLGTIAFVDQVVWMCWRFWLIVCTQTSQTFGESPAGSRISLPGAEAACFVFSDLEGSSISTGLGRVIGTLFGGPRRWDLGRWCWDQPKDEEFSFRERIQRASWVNKCWNLSFPSTGPSHPPKKKKIKQKEDVGTKTTRFFLGNFTKAEITSLIFTPQISELSQAWWASSFWSSFSSSPGHSKSWPSQWGAQGRWRVDICLIGKVVECLLRNTWWGTYIILLLFLYLFIGFLFGFFLFFVLTSHPRRAQLHTDWAETNRHNRSDCQQHNVWIIMLNFRKWLSNKHVSLNSSYLFASLLVELCWISILL